MNKTYTSRYEKRVQEAYQAHKESGAPTYILGIETSCDETSASVVRDGREVLSNVIASQADIHKRFGGVVPEVASRRHVENIRGSGRLPDTTREQSGRGIGKG